MYNILKPIFTLNFGLWVCLLYFILFGSDVGMVPNHTRMYCGVYEGSQTLIGSGMLFGIAWLDGLDATVHLKQECQNGLPPLAHSCHCRAD